MKPVPAAAALAVLAAAGCAVLGGGSSGDAAASEFALEPLEIPVAGPQSADVERECFELFEGDRADRDLLARDEAEARRRMTANDPRRRARLDELFEAGQLVSRSARAFAAWVLHHGETERDALRAYSLARSAAEEGSLLARWLACAAEDRACLRAGLPQRWGTQYVPGDDGSLVLAPVDGSVSDVQRQRWGVARLDRDRGAIPRDAAAPSAAPVPAPATPERPSEPR